ncbi:hypothetical protein ACODT5_28610 [Streptomyces sp. 5.8]|uniref:hypothetical protein n=1 Tax=Streptomyces sp. 5.8 TaxID=3406571 RepID=UPI003BB7C8EB
MPNPTGTSTAIAAALDSADEYQQRYNALRSHREERLRDHGYGCWRATTQARTRIPAICRDPRVARHVTAHLNAFTNGGAR